MEAIFVSVVEINSDGDIIDNDDGTSGRSSVTVWQLGVNQMGWKESLKRYGLEYLQRQPLPPPWWKSSRGKIAAWMPKLNSIP